MVFVSSLQTLTCEALYESVSAPRISRRQKKRRDVQIIVSTDTSTSDIFLSLFPLPGELKFERAERDALLLFQARDLVGCWRAIKLGDSERLDARERSVPNTRRVPASLPTKHHPACGLQESSVTIALPSPSKMWYSLLEFNECGCKRKIIILLGFSLIQYAGKKQLTGTSIDIHHHRRLLLLPLRSELELHFLEGAERDVFLPPQCLVRRIWLDLRWPLGLSDAEHGGRRAMGLDGSVITFEQLLVEVVHADTTEKRKIK